jgi:peptidoglycan-N-acetylglucosamine deacetylase
MIKKLLLAIVISLIQVNFAFALEVAISVDDLPANGNLPDHLTRMDIVKKIIFVFKKHNITGVYGLINGDKLNDPDGYSILKEWVKAGHYLGNHTFHHLDLAKTDSNQFITDIRKNEPILSKLMSGKDYHYFRYPFLSEGNIQEKRDMVRQFLFENGYKIAPVTVDFFEYVWNDPYVRCIKQHDDKSIMWLKETYLHQANNALIISHELSTMLFNRDIKNILLIHINSFTAEMLDDLLTEYEQHNIKFISLADALSDDVYQINPNIVRDRAYTFLNQIRLSKGLKNPHIVEKLYESLPEDKINQLCKSN